MIETILSWAPHNFLSDLDDDFTEINATSPTGIRVVQFGGPDITATIWDLLEAKVSHQLCCFVLLRGAGPASLWRGRIRTSHAQGCPRPNRAGPNSTTIPAALP